MDSYLPRGSVLRAAAVLALAAATPAGAASWRWFDTQPVRPLLPSQFAFGADGSLWTFSYDGVRRTDAAGQTATGVSPIRVNAELDRGVLLADGGAILHGMSGARCSVARVDAGLRRVWSATTASWCRAYAATPDGRVWLADEHSLVRIDANGQVGLTLPLGDAAQPATHSWLAVTSDGGVVLAAQPGGSRHVSLARYGSTGELRWSWAYDSLEMRTLLVASDGSVLLAGHTPASGYSVGNPTVMKLSSAGALQWRTATQGRLDAVSDAALTSDGAVVIAGNGAAHRIESSGALSWTREPCSDGEGFTVVAALPDGGAALGCSMSQGSRLVRVAASGAILSVTPLPLSYLWPLGVRTDGLVLAAGFTGGPGMVPALVAIDASGAIVTSPATAPVIPEAREILGQTTAVDGSTYLLTLPYREAYRDLYLRRVDAAGALAWSQLLPSDLQQWQLAANGTRVCTTLRRHVDGAAGSANHLTCYAAADGATIWQASVPVTPIPVAPGTVLPPPFGGTPPPAYAAQFSAVLDDGTLVLFRSEPATHEFLSFAANGQPLGAARLQGRVNAVDVDPSGVIIASIGTADGRSVLMRYDRRGTAWRIGDSANALGAIDVVDGSVAADGSVLAIARAASPGPWPGGPRELWYIAPDGTVAWQRAYAGGTAPVEIARVGSANYFVEYPAPATGAPTRITRLSARDGAVQWQIEVPTVAETGGGGKFAVSGDGAIALLASDRDDHVKLRRYDTVDGRLAAAWDVPCNAYCGPARALAIDAGNTARLVMDVADRLRGRVPAVFALPVDKFARFFANEGRLIGNGPSRSSRGQ